MSRLDAVEQRCADATEGPWEPYFTVHGDPFVVEAGYDLKLAHRIADVSTAPADYGKGNTLFIAAARSDLPDLAAAFRTVGEALRRGYPAGAYAHWCETGDDKAAAMLDDYDAQRRAALAVVDEWIGDAP